MATTETIAAFPLLGTVETGSSFPWLNAAGDGNYRSGKDALADFLEVGTLLAAKQDSNTSLDAIAGMTPSAFGLSLLDDADAATARTTLGLGSLSLLSSLETGALTHAPTNYTPSAATMAGHLVGIDTALAGGSGAFTADVNTQITPSTAIVLDQATGNEAALSLDYTTNKATSGNDTGLLIDFTDTASPGTSKLMDLQVGGVSKFSVNSAGLAEAVAFTSPNYFANLNGTTLATYMDRDGLRLNSGAELGWTASTSAFTTRDLSLYRDAAGTLAQRNGVNAQTYNIYNTYTDASNYERAHIGWNDTADTFVIGTEAGSGGGNQRPVAFWNSSTSGFRAGASSSQYLSLGTNGNAAWVSTSGVQRLILGAGEANGSMCVFPSGGVCVGDYPYTDPGDNRLSVEGGITVDQGTLTDDAQALNITSTWNDAADTFTLIKADVTDTASAAGSKLMDLQVGGVSQFSVSDTGSLRVATQSPSYLTPSFGTSDYNSGLAVWGNTKLTAVCNDVGVATFSSSTQIGLMLRSTAPLSWSNAEVNGSADLTLRRDAANTLAQRNGVNAQEFRLYNTYTDASNYEFGGMKWNANVLEIGTAQAGTGVARSLLLRGDNDVLMEVRNNTGSMGGIRTSTGVPLVTFRGNKTGVMEGSNLTINNVPTSDPGVVGRLWNDSGTLKVSAG